ncbi:FadR family transcriptional regulator [Alicyclobacillus cycloheptanicus]|uniref:GntR family transcriptional repressor for pyruvate dehydrogenase complex n=1 Tax=Alicyclobacillus cycloheptanicus TaxID=1457 RepID=A0ABT9XIE7_9BACL|nr:FadR/GntR family transcriptional regulator [Alicyclobacillus cycloheptanicus]MDQ0189890.1 GntR family transcriptional repressor for pyruvate dehydrogenase complex [Alicyclobacillus cycloheptanicus]WDM02206.1 FadR family transcriptional regulator [Alicyclobacillus cycloheptanicus]
MFQRVSDQTALSQKIIAQITDAIIRGELRPGDRMPTERDLAEMFGVSRTVIRDAIKILSGRGILDVKHGVGIFVSGSGSPSDNGLIIFEPNELNLRDAFETRQVLEPQAASWAAERADESHIVRLQTIMEDAWNHKTDLSVLYERDLQFHIAVAEASQNLVFVKLMWTLLGVLKETRRTSLQIPHRPRHSLDEHTAVMKAIANRDPQQARVLMAAHLSQVKEAVDDFLKR